MSGYTIIAGAGDSLVKVLREEMLANPSPTSKVKDPASITQAAAELSVYQYRILEGLRKM